MPTIPQFSEGGNEFPDRPNGASIAPERFGQDAAALQSFGGEIANFGSQLLSARKKAAEVDAVGTAHLDDIKWLADTSSDLKKNYTKKDDQGKPILGPDGQTVYDADGFTKEFNQRMDDRRQEQLAKMPTGDAQRQYIDATNRNYGLAYHEATSWENMTKAQTYKTNFEMRNNSDSNYLVNQQDPMNAIDFTTNSIQAQNQTLNASIGSINSPGEAQQMAKDAANTRIKALFIGLGNNAHSAQVGLQLINSITSGTPKDYQTGDVIPGTKLDARAVQNYFTPVELGNTRKRLQAVVDEGLRGQVTDLQGWARDQTAALSSADPSAISKYASIDNDANMNAMQALAKKGLMSQRYVDEVSVNLAVGKSYAIVRNEMAMMPDSEKGKFDQRIKQEYDAQVQAMGKPPGFALEHAEQYSKLNDRVWNNFQGQRDQDIAAYVETYGKSPAGEIKDGVPDQDRMAWRVTQANSLGRGGAVFQKDEISNNVADLKNKAATDPQAAAAKILDIKNGTGKYSTEAIKELVTKGHLPDYFTVAAQMDRPEVAQSIIENQEPKMKRALEESINPADKKLMTAAVTKEMGTSMQAFYGPNGGVKPAQELQQAAYLEAIQQKNQNGMNIAEASKAAVDKIVKSQYQTASYGKSNVFMPNTIGGQATNPKYVEGEMAAIYDPSYRAKMGILPPANLNSSIKADPDAAIAMGKWVTNADSMGATFRVPRGQSWIPVNDKNGRPVQIDFRRTSVNPSDAAIQYNKPFSQRVMEIKDDREQVDPMASFKGGQPAPNQSEMPAKASPQERAVNPKEAALDEGGRNLAGSGQDDYGMIATDATMASAKKLGLSNPALLAGIKDPTDPVKNAIAQEVINRNAAKKKKK